jgi:hypothetical protein
MTRTLLLLTILGAAVSAQTDPGAGWRKSGEEPQPAAAAKSYTVEAGTRIPLSMINSISTKHAADGDRIYLETVFPILVEGKIVIPPGSYVAGSVTEVKRAGKVKGRGELYVRFDSLTLPNGVTRDFRSRVGALDGRATEDLDKEEGKIKSEGTKGQDAMSVGTAAGAGAGIGSIATRSGMGAGIGAAAGAAAGLIGVLMTRGSEAVLAKGTTLDMVLDRPLTFDQTELDPAPMRRANGDGGGPLPSRKANNRYPLGRYPL